MPVLLITHERYLEHDPGRGHPERPERLRAVRAGIAGAGLEEALVSVPPRRATREEVGLAHSDEVVDLVERSSAEGGAWLDADTATSGASFDAALLAAGAGLTAVAELDAGAADSAFCAVRPPGHHATGSQPMGFCLFNNVAVTAVVLAERGERVLVVDVDAHHGNGTQDIFWEDPRVAYVSFHQHPLYPGTGGLRDVGERAGRGATVNVPLPPCSTGDAYLAGIDQLVRPMADAFEPTWLLVSAGFDAHRADPLTELGLSAGDFADISAGLLEVVPAGRTIAFLEGGYDLAALEACAGAWVAAMAGERHHAEAPTTGGPGREAVAAAALVRSELIELG